MPRHPSTPTGGRASAVTALAVTALLATATAGPATTAAAVPPAPATSYTPEAPPTPSVPTTSYTPITPSAPASPQVMSAAPVPGAPLPVLPAPTPSDAAGPMNHAFERAAARFGVPRDLLVAVAYGETHLDGHAGRPSQANGFGVMHLVSNPTNRTLEKAAALTGRPVGSLRRDTGANILGGAAVLRSYADRRGLTPAERADPDAWYPAVADYSGAEGPAAALYADTVLSFLEHGVDATAPGGEQVAFPGRPVTPRKEPLTGADERTRSPDYPPALWAPADPNNFDRGRTAAVQKVVIHVTQGSYAGSISWFQDPAAVVSAHYVVRSSDGEITQMVRDSDTAYHARSANASSLGVEHEGYVDDPSWFTDPMYRSSAALVRHLCDRYGIPKDRTHIVGHSEVPGNDHTDPGPHWDWTRYLRYVTTADASPVASRSDGTSR